MIPKSAKFPMRTEFLAFRAKAKQSATPHLRALILPRSDLGKTPVPATRLAVIMPKKASRLATTRNWLKRLTYDTVWPQIKAKNLDCVIIFKPLALTKASKATILAELKELRV